jgi:histidinol-phosphate aminotransferase
MGNTISRRTLLRRSALLAGGLPFAGSLLNQLQAAPSVNGHAFAPFASEGWTERDIALNAVEPLKARLFANENPFGPSDKAKQAITDTLPVACRYPFRAFPDFLQKISDH